MKEIVILGAGGFGREVAWLIEEINKKEKTYNLLGFLDENQEIENKMINGYKVLGNLEFLKKQKNLYFVVAVGNAKIKKLLAKKAIDYGGIAETLIHPSVIKSELNEIGRGVIICAGNIITVNAKIEDFVTLNLGCTVGHDAVIEKYTTVYPSVNISGNCVIGEESEIGTKTAIIQGISLGEKVITGAGSVIVKDFDSECTVIGVPAKAKA